MLLNSEWVDQEIKEEIQKCMETSENEEWKCVAVHTYIIKQEV